MCLQWCGGHCSIILNVWLRSHLLDCEHSHYEILLYVDGIFWEKQIVLMVCLCLRLWNTYYQAPSERIQQDCKWTDCCVWVLALAGFTSGSRRNALSIPTVHCYILKTLCCLIFHESINTSMHLPTLRMAGDSTSVADPWSTSTGLLLLLIAVCRKQLSTVSSIYTRKTKALPLM